MRIKEETVAEVVKEASEKMSDPNYSAVLVGTFVQQQAPTAQYIGAHAEDLGGAEIVVNVIFHAALISECFKRANNRTVPSMSFDQLNIVADGDRHERLAQRQPAIVEYMKMNLEEDAQEMRNVLTLVALAMDWVS